jgi:hypothetical protein
MAFCEPEYGSKILVLKAKWCEAILSGRKVDEVRGRRLAPGRYYLGCSGNIWGHVEVGQATLCETAELWRATAARHCVESPSPPYKKTWLHPLSSICRSAGPWPYIHPRGAIGIVIYRLPETRQTPDLVEQQDTARSKRKRCNGTITT